MGFDSPVHWLIVILVIALLFGGSRVGNLMGELGKGIKAFKSNLNEGGEPDTGPDKGKAEAKTEAPTSAEPETASARIAGDTSAPASSAPASGASQGGSGGSQGASAREPAPAGEESGGHGERR